MSTPFDPSPLTEREKLILHLRDTEGRTLQAIGERIGVSRERVRQILWKLKQPPEGKRSAPGGALSEFPKDIRCDLLNLGFRNLQQVQASLEPGHLHWNAELGRVCWKEHTVGWRGWETWKTIHQHMGLPCPGEPPSGEPPTLRPRRD